MAARIALHRGHRAIVADLVDGAAAARPSRGAETLDVTGLDDRHGGGRRCAT